MAVNFHNETFSEFHDLELPEQYTRVKFSLILDESTIVRKFHHGI